MRQEAVRDAGGDEDCSAGSCFWGCAAVHVPLLPEALQAHTTARVNAPAAAVASGLSKSAVPVPFKLLDTQKAAVRTGLDGVAATYHS